MASGLGVSQTDGDADSGCSEAARVLLRRASVRRRRLANGDKSKPGRSAPDYGAGRLVE